MQASLTFVCISGNQNSDNVCIKPDGPSPDPSDCSKFYLCTNGKAYHKPCREGTLYSARLMTCDHASNVKDCKSNQVQIRGRNDDNSIDDLDYSPVDSQEGELSSENRAKVKMFCGLFFMPTLINLVWWCK